MPDTRKETPKKGRTAAGIAALVLVCVLMMAAAFNMMIQGVTQQILESDVDTMRELAQHDMNSIRNSVLLRWDNMEGAKARMSIRDWQSQTEFLLAMKELIQDIPSAQSVAAVDAEGVEYLSTGLVRKGGDLATQCEGQTERFAARMNITSWFRENTHETLTLVIPVDFQVCDKRMKWLACEFPITLLESELKIQSYGGEGFSSVVDTSGNFIMNIARSHDYGSYENFFDTMKGATFQNYVSLEDILADSRSSEEALSIVYTLDGQEKIMVITSLDLADWYFITTVSTSVFSAQTRAILERFLVLLGMLSVVVFVLILIFARQRRAQDKLRLAEASNQAKTEFLFNMSHDIRTPMNAILGYTDIAIRHSEDPTQVRTNLKKIRAAGGHLLNLINDILEMSRIEAGRVQLVSTPVDMRKAIETVAQMNEALATAKSIDFITDVQDLRDPYVYADELHISEVIINLISNAIKYTPEGGKVWYTVRQLADAVEGQATYQFEIKDNGIGMSEEFQNHLFEAFSREEAPGVSKIEGAGLGLSIVKRIVDIAGGTIHVKSQTGEGSTFTVELTFPMMDAEAIAAFTREKKHTAVIPDEGALMGSRVLLVEDNEMNREIANEILTEAGLIVEEAEDGELAVDAVVEKGIEYYDFILMDIQMPVMNGYEATKAIRALQDGGRIPIIALSANAFEEDRKASLNAGMNDHVAKPINVKELFAAMAKFM